MLFLGIPRKTPIKIYKCWTYLSKQYKDIAVLDTRSRTVHEQSVHEHIF